MTDLQSLLFNIDISCDRPASGSLLIAEPFLREPYFSHAVIVIFDYDAERSAMGLVLNKQSGYTLNEIVDRIDDDKAIPVFCGGPMSGDHLYFIHRLGDIIPGGLEILPGVKVGGDFNLMVDYINSGYPTDGLVKFFLGYSGWEAEQLCGELDKKVWAVYNGTTPQMLLQGQGDSHWHHMVKLLGEPYRGWSYHPLNPKAN